MIGWGPPIYVILFSFYFLSILFPASALLRGPSNPLLCFLGGPQHRGLLCREGPSLLQQQHQQQQTTAAAAAELSLLRMAGKGGPLSFFLGAVGGQTRRAPIRGPVGAPAWGPLGVPPSPFWGVRGAASLGAAGRAPGRAAAASAAAPAAAAAAAAAAATAAEGAPLRRHFTRTKQVATIGPASWEKDQVNPKP